ncbi:unnamed protein product [Angiostrongylus costaricensis]|uniref:Mono(ADP-ribosyl)transferase n=1 Tax=Angiostrongylus costaricensis TaxID=334426 RepID=A0A158PFS0_ANGCS|nr:unnamed protein product [Angiostrongylus costaricensis]
MRAQEMFGYAVVISTALLCEGDPTTTSTRKPSTASPGMSKAAADDVEGVDAQLLTWLSEQKDEIPDKEVDTEELETTQQRHRSRAGYCSKYKVNFGNYCKSGNVDNLNHVLLQFCTSYTHHCEVVRKHFFHLSCGDGVEMRLRHFPQIVALLLNFSGFTIQSMRMTYEAQKVSQYCEKYLENFNFYCAGQSSPEYEKFCRSFRQNCPQKVGSLKESGSFLGGEGKVDESEGEGTPTSSDTLYLYKGTREDYCNKFSVHYEFYCKGSGVNTEITTKFCPFYKNSCKEHLDRRPCTADCDQRIFPHCTQSCKCDYAYPSVQKFCNPPPLPLFLNTCRDDPLRDSVDWASSMVLNPDDFEPSSKRLRRNERASDFHHRHAKRRVSRKAKARKDSRKRDDPTDGGTGSTGRAKDIPVVPSDSVFANALQQYGAFTDSQGILHRPHSTSPFTKPGLWEANPDNPHNRDHANKFFYRPESFNADWLNGQLAWGAHFAVPAVGVGGTDGFSSLYFPNAGSFLNIPDDYD